LKEQKNKRTARSTMFTVISLIFIGLKKK